MPAAGILDWKRSKYERPILHNSKSPEKLRRIILEYIKNIGRKKYQRGPTRRSQARGQALPPGRAPVACGPPGRPPVPIFCYMEGFDLEKIIRELSGRIAAVSRRNLGRSNLGLRQSCSAGETSFPEGEIEVIIITNDPLIERESISINIFTSTVSSPNPSSSLVFDLSLKTSDWYLWVASSVDYSL